MSKINVPSQEELRKELDTLYADRCNTLRCMVQAMNNKYDAFFEHEVSGMYQRIRVNSDLVWERFI